MPPNSLLLLPLLLLAGVAAAAAAEPPTPTPSTPPPPSPTPSTPPPPSPTPTPSTPPPPSPTPTPSTPPPPPEKNETLYELLPLYGLPAGLFPSSVTAFSLADNGSLTVDLAGPCSVHFEYLTYFEARVTGVLRYGSLTDIDGVQVRRFLFWFDVERVKVDLPPPSRYVYLDIGWITRKLPASDFQTLHDCEDSKRRCRLSSALATAATWFQDFFAQF